MAVLSRDALQALGFMALGENVQVSDRASVYGASRISLGSDVRIDDFCVLSAGAGGIAIGNNVHVAVYTSLIGAGAIRLGDFANLSSRVSVYSSSDDFSGATMTNPTVPDAYKNVDQADVEIGRHVIVGAGSVILPGATLGDGVAVGALSLVRGVCEPFSVWAGVPARRIGDRSRALLETEARLHASRAR